MRIDHNSSHIANPKKFKRIETIKSMFLDHNRMKLETSSYRHMENPKYLYMNKYTLKNPWV